MAPLIILVTATVLARLLGYAGVRMLRDWRAAARVGLAVMFGKRVLLSVWWSSIATVR